jgi:hypothetical protein
MSRVWRVGVIHGSGTACEAILTLFFSTLRRLFNPLSDLRAAAISKQPTVMSRDLFAKRCPFLSRPRVYMEKGGHKETGSDEMTAGANRHVFCQNLAHVLAPAE